MKTTIQIMVVFKLLSEERPHGRKGGLVKRETQGKGLVISRFFSSAKMP